MSGPTYVLPLSKINSWFVNVLPGILSNCYANLCLSKELAVVEFCDEGCATAGGQVGLSPCESPSSCIKGVLNVRLRPVSCRESHRVLICQKVMEKDRDP